METVARMLDATAAKSSSDYQFPEFFINVPVICPRVPYMPHGL
jgi:hypothetical protein